MLADTPPADYLSLISARFITVEVDDPGSGRLQFTPDIVGVFEVSDDVFSSAGLE